MTSGRRCGGERRHHQAILAGEGGPKRDIAVVNAAPAIVAAGMAEGFVEGVDLAQQAIDSGDAQGVLERVIAMSSEFAE